MSARKSGTAFALILATAFLLAAGFVVSRHEIWRDEAQAWLLAKDSRSLDDLALRIKFDAHPIGWYWGLFLLSRMTPSPAAMQIFHLLIAAAAVFVFARFAPFSKVVRILFASSYFIFYEYGVIARNYSIGVLALLLFCAAWPSRRRSLLLPAGALVLLAQTNTYMLIAAIALTVVLAAESFILRRAGRPRFLVFGLIVVLIGLGIGVFQVIPDPSSVYSKDLVIASRPDQAYLIFRLVAKTFVAVPNPGPNFWGNSFLDRFTFAPVLTPALAGLIVLLALLMLIDRPRALAFLVMTTGALALFWYFGYLGYIRHHGTLVIAFLAALWMSKDETPVRIPGRIFRRAPAAARRAIPAFLVVMLGVQTIGTAVAVRYDLVRAFSQGKRAARFIRERGLQDRVLVGDHFMTMSPVSAYLDRPIYLPWIERWGSYTVWLRSPHASFGMTQILAAAERLSREAGKDYLIILNYPLNKSSLMTRHLRRVAAIEGAVLTSECYYLYRKDTRFRE